MSHSRFDETELIIPDRTSATEGTDAPKGPPRFDRGHAVGRYIVFDHIGSGGMGVVYRAYDPDLDRQVAVKVLAVTADDRRSGLDRARLLREAQALAKLSHPNVIAIYDVGVHHEQVFLAMELVDGTDLKKWLRDQQRSWREIVEVFQAAGQGIAAAHAAGLVHRDFKPSNVLLGRDGRVRVVDFGVARSEPASPATQDGPESDSDVDVPQRIQSDDLLTEDGAVVGTPAYMALEQHLGSPVDPRSDQFSFCVALYEALYGVRPFRADTLVDLARAKTLPVVDPPSARKVPAWLRRLVARGLSAQPNERFASMDALLEALAADPIARWRRLGLAAGFIAIIAAAVVASRQSSEPADPCEGAEQQLATAWEPERAARIADAFDLLERAYATEAWQTTHRVLDEYAAEWTSAFREVCEATRVRRVRSIELSDLQMACLNQRLSGLASLAQVYEQVDDDVAKRAVDAAHSLARISTCLDVEAMAARTKPPEDDAAKAAVEDVRTHLTGAKALLDAGKSKDAAAIAEAAVVRATELGYRPLEAEALLLAGLVQTAAHDTKKAAETLLKAAARAKAGRHDLLEARAWIALIRTIGHHQAEANQAQAWATMAAAALEAAGGDDELESQRLEHLATVSYTSGDPNDAIALFERAIELKRSSLGDDHPALAGPYTHLAMVGLMQDKLDVAEAHHRTALEIQERTLGAQHPEVATSLRHIGFIVSISGDLDQALEYTGRALEIREAALGKNHPEVARNLTDVGTLLARSGDFAGAIDAHRRAVAIIETVNGPVHPTMATSLHGLGAAHEHAGELEHAYACYERVVAIRTRTLGAGHPFAITAIEDLAELAEKQNDGPLVVEHRAQVVARLERSRGLDADELVSALRRLGLAKLELGAASEARRAIERAYTIAQRADDPDELARTQFALARSLAAAHVDRARALELATSAHTHFAESNEAFAAEIQLWIDQR